MNKLMKFLTPLIALAALFLFVSPAQAAPAIPPTEECVGLMKTVLKESIKDSNDGKERALYQQLVTAGCLTSNPFDSVKPMPKEECSSLASEVSNYLAPANEAALPIAKRLRTIDNNLQKRDRADLKRLKKATKKGNQKAINKIERRLEKSMKNYVKSLTRLANNNRSKIDQYGASSLLVVLDMITKGCDPNRKWWISNPASEVFIFLWITSRL